ncbi:MAG: hypothetical protein RIB93_21630 [Coleofasciculus sp. D1-CHI-01]|uniref:NACHT C-terminal helical domain 2-containing protein n=1 Tax=Coleofasciculus sp. D1-CHI-01 TaxID=3068482 RepID=UPI0032F9DB59
MEKSGQTVLCYRLEEALGRINVSRILLCRDDPRLGEALQDLKQQLPDLDLNLDGNEWHFKQWWQTHGIFWTEQLSAAIQCRTNNNTIIESTNLLPILLNLCFQLFTPTNFSIMRTVVSTPNARND